MNLSSKSRHKKGKNSKAQFGSVLNWAFVAQSGSRTALVEKVNIVVEESGNIESIGQIEVEKEFILDPAIECFHNRIVCGNSPSRYVTKYVIIMMGLAKGL